MLPRTNLWRVNTLEKTSQGGKCFLLGIALHYRNHNSNFHNQHHHHLLGCILRAKTSFLTPGKNDQPVKLVIWAISESHHFSPGKSSLIGLSGIVQEITCLYPGERLSNREWGVSYTRSLNNMFSNSCSILTFSKM